MYLLKPRRLRSLVLSLLCLQPAIAAAEIRFNGFLSVGGGLVDSDEATFLGFDDGFSFDTDSVFALQATAPISDRLSATGQLVARGVEDYDVVLEWGFLTYQATDELQLRAGRLRAPFFSFSDYLEVGYAYPFIRPPSEVYGNIPFSGVDGVDFVYTRLVAGWDASLQGYYGRFRNDIPLPGSTEREDTDIEDLGGVVLSANRDWLTLRGGYHRADVNIFIDSNEDLATLTGFLRQFGFDDVADTLLPTDKGGEFYQLGTQIDYEDWLFIAEWTHLDFDPMLFTDTTGWYATFGRRISDFTLLYTYAAEETDDEPELFAGLPPEGADPGTDLLRGGVATVAAAAQTDGESHKFGLRWDFTPGAAFKLEYQRRENNLPDGESLNVFSFVFDMVF